MGASSAKADPLEKLHRQAAVLRLAPQRRQPGRPDPVCPPETLHGPVAAPLHGVLDRQLHEQPPQASSDVLLPHVGRGELYGVLAPGAVGMRTVPGRYAGGA